MISSFLDTFLSVPAGPVTSLWGIQAELSGAVIVLYAHTDEKGLNKLSMHYVAGISTGNGGVGGSFRFYNVGLLDKNNRDVDGREMSIWGFLDVLELRGKTPVMMIGVAGKKGWW